MEIENLTVLKNKIAKLYEEYITFCLESFNNINRTVDTSNIVKLHIKVDKFIPSVVRILNSKDKKTIGQVYTANDTNNWSNPISLSKEHLMLLKTQATQIFKVVVYKIDRESNECKVVDFSISDNTTSVRIFVEVIPKTQIKKLSNGLQADETSEALSISFPDYKIETPLGYLSGLGHAGVLLISPLGKTIYYEYGRYDPENLGLVRRTQKSISNVIIGKDGLATKESLKAVLKEISKQAGNNGKIKSIYFKNMDFDKMNAYAMQKFKENNDENRAPYSLPKNNCGTFAYDVIKQSPNAKILSDKELPPFSSPIDIVDELDKKYQHINYNPKIDKIQFEYEE